MEDAVNKPVPQYGVWAVTFSAYIELYLLYAMGIVFGPVLFFSESGVLRWAGLAFFVAGISLPGIQIWYLHRKASRMTPQERRQYYLHKLEVSREKDQLGI